MAASMTLLIAFGLFIDCFNYSNDSFRAGLRPGTRGFGESARNVSIDSCYKSGVVDRINLGGDGKATRMSIAAGTVDFDPHLSTSLKRESGLDDVRRSSPRPGPPQSLPL